MPVIDYEPNGDNQEFLGHYDGINRPYVQHIQCSGIDGTYTKIMGSPPPLTTEQLEQSVRQHLIRSHIDNRLSEVKAKIGPINTNEAGYWDLESFRKYVKLLEDSRETVLIRNPGELTGVKAIIGPPIDINEAWENYQKLIKVKEEGRDLDLT